MTTYKLRFHTLALAEWKKLDGSVRAQFKKKLEERLLTPRVASAALSSMPDGYRIKLRAAGDRLVYRVDDGAVWMTVISIGLRERLQAYSRATSPPGRPAAGLTAGKQGTAPDFWTPPRLQRQPDAARRPRPALPRCRLAQPPPRPGALRRAHVRPQQPARHPAAGGLGGSGASGGTGSTGGMSK